MRSVVSAAHDPVAGETAAAEPVAIDPVILARVREAQSAIRRSLGVAERVLGSEGLPLSIVAGSAVLADFDLGDGVRRRAVSACPRRMSA